MSNTPLTSFQPVPRVYQSRDLAAIQDRSQGDLSVIVTYNGISKFTEIAPAIPNRGTVTHEFIVWVVARSAKQHAGQIGTRELADPVLEKIVCLLMGHRLIKGLEPLHITPSALSPVYSDNGYGYFSLTFHQRARRRHTARRRYLPKRAGQAQASPGRRH